MAGAQRGDADDARRVPRTLQRAATTANTMTTREVAAMHLYPRATFNGTLTPATEARLRTHIADIVARERCRLELTDGVKLPGAAVSSTVCHRLGLDLCIARASLVTLYLRGMAPLLFLRAGQPNESRPVAAAPGGASRTEHRASKSRRAAIAWLANLARLRFALTTTDSAHARRAAERIEAACAEGDIPPSPLAFGEAEIAAAMRLGSARSEMTDIETCLARLAEAAGDTPLSPGWRR